jgi:hypothetical protein
MYMIYIYIIIYLLIYIYLYLYIYTINHTIGLDWKGKTAVQCSPKKMVDLTQDLKAERNKTYNVKHEPKRIREIQTS